MWRTWLSEYWPVISEHAHGGGVAGAVRQVQRADLAHQVEIAGAQPLLALWNPGKGEDQNQRWRGSHSFYLSPTAKKQDLQVKGAMTAGFYFVLVGLTKWTLISQSHSKHTTFLGSIFWCTKQIHQNEKKGYLLQTISPSSSLTAVMIWFTQMMFCQLVLFQLVDHFWDQATFKYLK